MWWLSIRRNVLATEVTKGEQGATATPGLPIPGFHCQKEKSPQNMAIKTSEDFNYPDKTENCWKFRCFLKRLVHRLTHLQDMTLGSSRGTRAQKSSETNRK